ncbi:MAG: NUDIX hydrolase [Candidatus Natronoplasma sp.]
MEVEKPDDEELQELYRKFGEPEIKEEEVSLSALEYKGDYPECKGEAVLEIKRDNKVVGVRHRRGEKFVLPMGRVWKDESFVEGTKREAVEETGLEVELKSLKEVRKVTFEFSNAELERWHLLFEAEAVGGELEPKDKEEIEEVKLFEGEWYWSKGFYILRR